MEWWLRTLQTTRYLLFYKQEAESELYCHSEAIERRSNLILQKSIDRFENELQKIANGLSKKGGIKKYDKIQQKIGRIKEKYSKVANQFNSSVTGGEKKERVETITWIHNPENVSKAAGIYCIRTNQIQLNHKEI